MDKEARKTMRAWVGKTIQFPVGIQSTVLNKDTLWQVPETPYKILLYTDSVGCTSCKLLLVLWRSFIKEVDATMKDRLSFLFYFQPKDKNELNFIFKRDHFYYPVFIDEENKIDKLNKFPKRVEFQCFLLNKDNKVIFVGNPVFNPRIWELYKRIVTDTIQSGSGKK